MHITLKTKDAPEQNPNLTPKEDAPSFHVQLLKNIKAKALGTPFELPPGINASGVLSKDSISFAGITVEGVVFGEAESMWNKWLSILPPDGVLGLGLQGMAPEGVRPILDVMAEQGVISERVFGMWLGRDPEGGELTLGGLNDQLYQGELTWANLTPPDGQWWTAPADSIVLDGLTQLDLCPGGHCVVLPASNSPYFIVSEAQAAAINEALGGLDIGQPGAAGLDCTTLYRLPNLTITVGGRAMVLGPLEYTFLLRFEGGLQMCVSGFLGFPGVDDHTMLLGTLFMQKYYIAFDRENNRLGFADSA
ncbi:Cathepsin D [Amphibalanus amphitrite]|uniref:Cathepsin D n=1 Tax=Amphibalanus amphitrite TaxID=1232801 RepID=A0A6A4WPI4_AMPAM|nr:Cathepsin D [Amphibalanus amphitrite]